MAGSPFLDCLPAVVNELSHALQVTSQLILVQNVSWNVSHAPGILESAVFFILLL